MNNEITERKDLICESCGQPGTEREEEWHAVLCNDCEIFRMAKIKERKAALLARSLMAKARRAQFDRAYERFRESWVTEDGTSIEDAAKSCGLRAIKKVSLRRRRIEYSFVLLKKDAEQ